MNALGETRKRITSMSSTLTSSLSSFDSHSIKRRDSNTNSSFRRNNTNFFHRSSYQKSKSVPSSPASLLRNSNRFASSGSIESSPRTYRPQKHSNDVGFGVTIPNVVPITAALNITPVRKRPPPFISDTILSDKDSKRFHSVRNLMRMQVLEEIKIYQGILSNERKTQTVMISNILDGVKEFTSSPNNVQLGKAIVSLPEMKTHTPHNMFNQEFGNSVKSSEEKAEYHAFDTKSEVSRVSSTSRAQSTKSPSKSQGGLLSRRWSYDQQGKSPVKSLKLGGNSNLNQNSPRQPWNSSLSSKLGSLTSRLESLSRPRSTKIMQSTQSPPPRMRLTSVDRHDDASIATAPPKLNHSNSSRSESSTRNRTATLMQSVSFSTPNTPRNSGGKSMSPRNSVSRDVTPTTPIRQRRLSSSMI